MKKVITGDKTETFINPIFNESYHSHTGAVEEALRKYAEPCKIKELAKSGSIKILDMFFGLGYNSAMAIDIALKANPNCHIEVVGIENDPEIIRSIQDINPPIDYFKFYKTLTENNLCFEHGNISVKVVLGDANESVKNLEQDYFDAIFYDPFSPKTQPEMWSPTLFKEMHRVIKEKGILSTYSCARIVRENMQKAGFMYDEGPVVGRRGPGTIAFKWEI
tara:strand:+ start:17536 stop:18195 length:660 start_codon:yes stop_codon:yes gene_type:complete